MIRMYILVEFDLFESKLPVYCALVLLPILQDILCVNFELILFGNWLIKLNSCLYCRMNGEVVNLNVVTCPGPLHTRDEGKIELCLVRNWQLSTRFEFEDNFLDTSSNFFICRTAHIQLACFFPHVLKHKALLKSQQRQFFFQIVLHLHI